MDHQMHFPNEVVCSQAVYLIRASILVGLAGLIQWSFWVIQWKFVHYPWGACTRNVRYTYTRNATYMNSYIVTLHVMLWGVTHDC